MRLRDLASTILLFFEAIWYTIDSVFLWIYLAIAARDALRKRKHPIDIILDESYKLCKLRGYPVYEIVVFPKPHENEEKINEEDLWWR